MGERMLVVPVGLGTRVKVNDRGGHPMAVLSRSETLAPRARLVP